MRRNGKNDEGERNMLGTGKRWIRGKKIMRKMDLWENNNQGPQNVGNKGERIFVGKITRLQGRNEKK